MASANQPNLSKKRSHTEAFNYPLYRPLVDNIPFHGKLFRIKKQSVIKTRLWCSSHQSNIVTISALVGDMVTVIPCDEIGDRCLTMTDYVVVKVLDGNGRQGHIPIDCIEEEHSYYGCFMCYDHPESFDDWDELLLHLFTDHFAFRGEDLKCSDCQFSGGSITDFIKHIKGMIIIVYGSI
jgi:hypothetical protein